LPDYFISILRKKTGEKKRSGQKTETRFAMRAMVSKDLLVLQNIEPVRYQYNDNEHKIEE
jgi:hypothetical protein